MKNNRIFLFSIGKDDKANELKEKLKLMNFEVHLGPTYEDDKYLEENFEYYKKAKKDKIYSFMSDIYRFWKLTSEGGIYLDISLDVNPSKETEKQLRNMFKYNFFAYKSNDLKLESAVIAGQKGNYVSNSALSYFEIVSNIPYKDMRAIPNCPNILTMLYRLENPPIDFNDFNNDRWHIESFKAIRNKNTLFKYGFRSWKKTNSDFDWWQNQEDMWDKKESTLKREIKELKKTYKGINKGLKNIIKNTK